MVSYFLGVFNPGGVRVLLANPRWERRFVKFLELSRVERVIADRTDEDSADRRVGDLGSEEEGRPEGLICIPFLYSSFISL
jgi:hypothetical protein